MYIPTIIQLYQNISNDFKNKLNLSDDELKKVLNAVSLVLAAQLKLNYLALSDIQNNLFPDTADSSANGGTLDRFGLIYLNRVQRPASNGVFQINIVGEIGSVLRAGLTFKSNDDSLNPGQLYILDTEHVMAAENETIEIRSVGSGVDYSLEIGNILTITEPVIGVEQTVSISAITTPPLAAESEASFRKSIIDAIQLEPQGGAKTDYRLWASDAQGVQNSYPYVKDSEAGTVQIYIEATEADSTDGFGTPDGSLLSTVEDVIEFDPDITKPLYERGRRPIQATIEVLPIVPNPIDVTITGLNENSAAITDAIQSNLKEYLKTVRPFVAGGDLARNKNDILYAARLQSIVTDIIDASNFFTEFDVFVNGVEQTSYLFSRENIPYLRNLNFA